MLSPAQITRVVEASSGMELVKEEARVTHEGMLDAYWEVSSLLWSKEKELDMLRNNGVDEKEVAVLEASFDAVASAARNLNGGEKGVRCMDYWVGVFCVT